MGSKHLEFGAFGHSSARVRYHIENVNNYMNTLRFEISELKLGSFFLSNLQANQTNKNLDLIRVNMILGGEPYVIY
jgi:hypothetical protein